MRKFPVPGSSVRLKYVSEEIQSLVPEERI